MANQYIAFRGSPSGEVEAVHLKTPQLGPKDVLLENTHSGVCGTDAHNLHRDIVLGHEGVGVVKAIGYDFHCENGGKIHGVTDFDQGTFATHSVWPETRLVPIPESIPSLEAAPLLCAGQTVFVPFIRDKILPTESIGIIGIGGLGHLNISIAAAWGCHVTVLSSTESKKEEAMRLGAHEFVNIKKSEAIQVKRKIDRLFVTTSAQPDWKK
ncbi:MAG: hypothetical protein Q9227_009544 [Pyrenula ochraceoflavens]